MSDEKTTPHKSGFADDRHAPVIYFDAVPAGGLYNGVVALTLSVDLARTIDPNEVTVSHTVIAYLRTSLHGAQELRAMLDRAILLATPALGGSN